MLIIDGNSVFEIDEECVKQKNPPEDCDIKKYIKEMESKTEKPKKLNVNKGKKHELL